MIRLLSKLLLLTLVATAHGQNDFDYYDYDLDDAYTPTEILPTFLTTPQVFSVEVGGDITFPCEVQDLGKHTLMFKHIQPNGVNRLLFLGDINVKKTKAVVKKGNTFELSGVKKYHSGQYACRIETTPVAQITHTLHVQYPATVHRVSPEVQQVEQGASVTLECHADGNPTAAISWSRKQGHLPSGAQSEEGLSITLENVDRHVEGTYICTASNGIGPPSSVTMTIEVEYPPEVITEQTIFHTGEGYEAKLMCIVRGRPAPEVRWKKNGKPLDPSHHLTSHDSLHRHTLSITKVLEDDFGDYICTAKNSLGEKKGILRLTGLPKTPRMRSSPAGGEKNLYTLTWETESYTPIIQYRLQYRRFTGNMTGQPQVKWNVRLFSTDPPTHPSTQHGSGPTHFSTDPSPHHSSGPNHFMGHTIPHLEEATDYEARVAVENKFGWSEDSKVFHFYTRKEVAIGQSSQASGCGAAALSLAAVVLALLLHLS